MRPCKKNKEPKRAQCCHSRRKCRSTTVVTNRTKPKTTQSSKPNNCNANAPRRVVITAEYFDDWVTSKSSKSNNNNNNNSNNKNNNPRSFPTKVKQECWENAKKVRGRDPDRWRKDALGNVVFRKFMGCSGGLCYDFDHILPYSKGGKSTQGNCQILQSTINRSKGSRTDITRADLIQKKSCCRISGRDMDLIEYAAYGDVHRK